MFHPELPPASVIDQLPNSKQLVTAGVFKTEKLVNLAKHDYSLEPNVTFTPDMKWIVFRSNMFGPTHVFAVEVAKSELMLFVFFVRFRVFRGSHGLCPLTKERFHQFTRNY